MKKRIKYKDGSEYLGSLNENKQKHGKGKLIYTNGEEFIGEWKLDKKDGFGIYHDKDKKIITGDPEKIKKIYDTWVFSRDTTSQNPNWQLVDILT